MQEDGILRCILTVKKPRSERKAQICVFVIGQGNKMYTVRAWPDHLQEQLNEDIDVKRLNKLNYDEDVTRALNAEEKLIGHGSALASLMVNDGFE